MRKLSLLTAAVALIAAITAMSASAALHTGSATGPLVAANATVSAANSGAVTLQSSFFGTTVTCNNSSVSLTSSNYGATPVAGSITALSFTNCSSGCGSASVSTAGFPWTGGSLATTTSPNGTLKALTGGQNVTVTTCGLTCKYGAGTSGVSAPFTGGATATVVENVSLTDTSCLDTATWKGTYTTTGPLGNGLFTS